MTNLVIPLTVRCFLYFFTTLLLMSGITLMGISIWSVIESGPFQTILSVNPTIFDAQYLMIVVGVALILTSIFGFYAIATKNRRLLKYYFYILFLVFVMQFTASVILFVQLPRAKQAAIDSISNNNQGTKDAWDNYQTKHQCCGYTGYSEWSTSIPESCCTGVFGGGVEENDQCSAHSAAKGRVFTQGCEKTLSDHVNSVAGVGMGFIVILIVTMVLTYRHRRALKKGPSATETSVKA